MPTEEQTYRKSTEEKLDNLDRKTDEILKQTTKHNSRLQKAELAHEKLKTRVNTSVALFVVLILPLIFSLIESGHLIS